MPVPIPDRAKPRILMKEVLVEAPPSGTPSNAARGRQTSKLGEISRHSDGKFDPTVEASTPKKIVFEKMYEIRFAGDEELMERMSWMRSHLSHRFPKGATYQEIFKYAMRYVRECEDMTKRAERRKKRQMPFARGGPSTAENLRLLCAKHNRHTAERVYGKAHMERYRRQE